MFRKAVPGDLDQIAAIYDAIHTEEESGRAAARSLYAGLGYQEVGIVSCDFNGIPGIRLVCLEKLL